MLKARYKTAIGLAWATAAWTTAASATTVALVGCADVQNRRPIESPRASRTEANAQTRRDRPTPVDDARLASFGMEMFWDSWIRDETIAKLQLEADPVTGQGNIYAYTESNRLYQVDPGSGKVNWVFEVGAPLSFMDHDRPIAEFCYPRTDGDPIRKYDEVYFIAKDVLFALDKKDGSELWRLELKFGAASPPQATPTHVLVGGWDQRVYAVQKSDPTTHDWMYRTEGDILARAAQDSPSAFVASTDGNLYTFEASNGQLTSTFRTEKRLSADPVIYKKLLYLAGEDYNLYVLSALDGRQEFRYPAGAPMKKAPIAIANPIEKGKSTATVYCVTESPEPGVVAILRGGRVPGSTKTSHEFLWKRDGAQKVLARGRDTVFLLEGASKDDPVRTKRIVKVDWKSCYLRDELKVSGVDYYLSNPCDPHDKKSLLGGLVIVGYRNGWIMAFKEKSPYPVD